MNPQRWRRINDLFERAAGLPAEQWEEFLARESGNDTELVNEVLRLLRAPNRGKFIEPPTVTGGASSPPLGDPWIGRRLGDFELLELIGRGGMGIVFRARQLSLRREVAVKVLPASPLIEPRQIERFEREARAAAKLRHPNVVAIHAVGRESDLLYFAMELVDGPDLATEIRRLVTREAAETARLPAFDSPDYVTAVVRVVEQAADALAYAHEHAILHRDIKPHNLLVDSLGNVRVVDFGLARDDGDAPVAADSETNAGTVPYMSPEQARRSMHRVDARTDVYSLGVVLYELLALRRPFDGASAVEIFHKIVHEDPPRLRKLAPRVPRDLELVCNTAMARELSDRYASAADFRDDLRRFLRHEAVVARGPTLGRRVGKLARRHRIPLLIGAASAATLVFALRFASIQARERSFAERASLIGRVLAWSAEDWDANLYEVRAAREEYLRSRSDTSALPPDLRQLLSQLGARFELDRAARTQSADTLRRVGLGGTVRVDAYGGYGAPPSEREVALAQDAFERASAIYYDDVELRRLADASSAFPRVLLKLDAKTTAETGVVSARVSVRPIDPLIGTRGDRIELGSTPLDRRIPPGNWRFSVEIPGFGFAECTRYLVTRDRAYELDVRVRREAELCSELVIVPAGTYVFGGDRPMACDVGGPSAEFEEFWIDPAEVSNAQYLAFLADTGRGAPKRWRDVQYDGDWRRLPIGSVGEKFLELPVTGINYEDAQAYAEWSGMRLGTHVELERALRGQSGLRYPWLGSKRDDRFGQSNVGGESVSNPIGACARFASYVLNVRPVREPAYFQNALQLFHAFGNVAEYTESLIAEPHDGVLYPLTWERLYLGAMWDADRHKNSLDFHATTGVGERYTKDFVGIRCVRSSTP